MKKSLLKIAGSTEIQKVAQKSLNGGLSLTPVLSDCQSGCYSLYFCPGGGSGGNGHPCAVPSPSGAACFGTIQNGKCCI